MSAQKRTVLTFETLAESMTGQSPGTRYRCHRCGRVGVLFNDLERLFRATKKHLESCPRRETTGVEKAWLGPHAFIGIDRRCGACGYADDHALHQNHK